MNALLWFAKASKKSFYVASSVLHLSNHTPYTLSFQGHPGETYALEKGRETGQYRARFANRTREIEANETALGSA
jgi:hypothetical protein